MTDSIAHLAAQSKILNVLCIAGCTPDEHNVFYKLFTDPVAFFTMVLAFFTVLLWRATWKATKLAEEQHVRSNRAFAYLARFDHYLLADGGLRVVPIFKNSGLSPTRNALISIDSREIGGDLPSDFDYAISTVATVAFIGPGAKVAGQSFTVGSDVVARVLAGQSNYFIWGNITYRDIFKRTEPHATEFCFRMTVINANGGYFFGFSPYGGRNRSDTDTRLIEHPTNVWSSFMAGVLDIRRKQ